MDENFIFMCEKKPAVLTYLMCMNCMNIILKVKCFKT